MCKKSIFYFGVFLYIFCAFVQTSLAENDYYIDGNYKYQGNGTKEQPFNKISQAVEVGAKNIHVANGNYEENFTLRDINLIGENREKTVIMGMLVMEGNSGLENLSVIKELKLDSEKKHGEESIIWVSDKSEVFIKNIFVSGGNIGIETDGTGKLFLENSEITKNGKGVSIKKDGIFNIINSKISYNYGEGVDVRDNVKGEILNSEISGNGEGNIELVAGKTQLRIVHNLIENGLSNGITIQYYDSSDFSGELIFNENNISGNKEYGIACKRPSGGSPGGKYWSESIKEMKDNVMRENEDGTFYSSCKFSDEMKFNALKTETLDGEIEKEHYRFLKDEVGRQIVQTAVQNRSKVKTFLIGSDYERLNELENKAILYRSEIDKLNELLQKVEDQKSIDLIEGDKRDIEELNKNIDEFIVQERNKFSLFGWLFD